MISDFEQMFKNAGVALNRVILTEGVAELKRQYPLISDNDYNQLIAFDPTYKGSNELGKYGRWILDLYNQFVKDRNNEEKYEKAKSYVAEHPEAKMPPAPVLKSQDRVEDFQKLPDLLKDLEAHLNDVKEPIQSFKSVADLASAVRSASEKDITVDKKAQKNYKVFREAISDGLKVMYQDNDWIIGVPETYESSAHFKKPVTNWCTAYPDMYGKYKEDFGGNYYIHLNKHTGDLYQLHAESMQFKDASDKEINLRRFISQNPKLKSLYKKIVPKSSILYSVLTGISLSVDEQRAIIKQNPMDIKYISKPTDAIMQYAVALNPYSIMGMDNPSEKLKRNAISVAPSVIGSIENPSLELQMQAINQAPRYIDYIAKPAKEVQIAAVSKSPSTISYLKNPCEEAQILAVSKEPKLIKYIENPTEKAQLIAVKKYPFVIEDIKTPSVNAQLAAVREDADVFDYISKPASETMELQKELYG